MSAEAGARDFPDRLAAAGEWPLRRGPVRTLQVNVGRRCDLACHHCHVEAGPKRTESMDGRTADRVLELLARNPEVEVLDLTGGAPELNENFRALVGGAVALGRRVIDRCNLTVLLVPGQEDTAAFLADHGVEIVASLPCYTDERVDAQRGRGVFEPSVTSGYNPTGAFLPPSQGDLEARYRIELRERLGVEFSRLVTITNIPIRRFARDLLRRGELFSYMALLVNHFNPATLPALMCRSLLSVGYDGRLHDCDFNQALEMALGAGPRSVWEVDDLRALDGATIAVAGPCFGCTAGAGSSCGGALVSADHAI